MRYDEVRYPSGLSDERWELIRLVFEAWKAVHSSVFGHRGRYAMREIVNAILDQMRTGCQWRYLPRDLPPYGAVYYCFALWRGGGSDQRIHDLLRMMVREAAGRGEDPSAVVLDSQSVCAAAGVPGSTAGLDAARKTPGRGRGLARMGGTITKAPLGYRNERIMIDGREVAISSVDRDRAPHLCEGFELYGTGQYSAAQVLAKLNAAGLRTRGTRKTAPKPLSLNQFYKILADPYYGGTIEYEVAEYPGRHEALISPELFDRVQRVLALHGGGGTRNRVHQHYLKGLLWRGRCGRRFILVPGRGNGGTFGPDLLLRPTRRADQADIVVLRPVQLREP